MDYFKLFSGAIPCICFLGGLQLHAQDKGSIKKDPFIIKGNVGTSANFYSSNEPDSSRTRLPYALSAYGSLVARYKNLSIPVSFVVNRYSNGRNSSFAQYGMSPTYKWAKIHLGYRYIPFSPLTFDGQSFKGLGVELKPGILRFAAFYGKLNKAVDEDTSRSQYIVPRFSRTGYGVKLGIGNANNFFDLMYFHAKDDSNSVTISDKLKNTIRAQENSVLGVSFKLRFFKKVSFAGDVAVSGITEDQAFGRISPDSAGKYQEIAKLFSKFLPYNASTLPSFAGQSSLSLLTRYFNSAISYRRIEPDFKSLGTPYMLHDIELGSWTNNITAVKGRLNLGTSLSYQHNNLNHTLNSELQAAVGSVNLNALLSQRLNINMNLMNYRLNQKNGTLILPDSLLLDQLITQFGISPSYNFQKGSKMHFVSGSVNLSVLDDKNPSSSARTNSNNVSASLNYTMSLIKKQLSFSVSGLFNHYEQDLYAFSSYGGNLGSSVQLLKEKRMKLQGNIGYFYNTNTSSGASPVTAKSNNITYSLIAGYNVRHHAFNVFANLVQYQSNPINDTINKLVTYTVTTNNKAAGISYNYSF